MKTLIALLLLTSVAWADVPKQQELDALALISLGPDMCNMNTQAWWNSQMIASSRNHNIKMNRLIALVRKSRKELVQGFKANPVMIEKGCSLLRKNR